MSDFDGYAVEVVFRSPRSWDRVRGVVSLGPDAVCRKRCEALSMGAGRAIHLKTERVPTDGFAIAAPRSPPSSHRAATIYFCSEARHCSMSGVVGPMTAELLGCLTSRRRRSRTLPGKGTARRELEGSAEILEFPLPAVVSIDEASRGPHRYPPSRASGREEEAARS